MSASKLTVKDCIYDFIMHLLYLRMISSCRIFLWMKPEMKVMCHICRFPNTSFCFCCIVDVCALSSSYTAVTFADFPLSTRTR
jgi:hypothetical protein